MKVKEVIEKISVSELRKAAERASMAWNHGPNAASGVLQELSKIRAKDRKLKLVNARKDCGTFNWLTIAAQIHHSLHRSA